MSIEERLERLERQNQWMRRLGAVGVALVASVFLMGQGKEKGEAGRVVAREIVLKDQSGHVQLRAVAGDHGATLHFYGEGDQARVAMGLSQGSRTAGQPFLDFRDADGRYRVKSGVNLLGHTELLMFDEHGSQRILISAGGGRGGIGVYAGVPGPNEKIKEVVLAASDSKGPYVTLRHGEAASMRLGMLASGSPQLRILDNMNNDRVTLGTRADGTPVLELRGDSTRAVWESNQGRIMAARKVIWQAPKE